LVSTQFFDPFVNDIEDIVGGKSGWILVPGLGSELFEKSCNPDHVKLVEIRAEDCEEFDSFQKGEFRISCEFEDAGVEVEPANLSIDKELRAGFRS
jgi:hypothetical protein